MNYSTTGHMGKCQRVLLIALSFLNCPARSTTAEEARVLPFSSPFLATWKHNDKRKIGLPARLYNTLPALEGLSHASVVAKQGGRRQQAIGSLESMTQFRPYSFYLSVIPIFLWRAQAFLLVPHPPVPRFLLPGSYVVSPRHGPDVCAVTDRHNMNGIFREVLLLHALIRILVARPSITHSTQRLLRHLPASRDTQAWRNGCQEFPSLIPRPYEQPWQIH